MNIKIDKNWTLFLDRDGVINKKIDNDYVKKWSDFIFIEGVLEAISFLSNIFGLIIVVTNQRGVGKGLMTEEDLNCIHHKMSEEIKSNSGNLDKIYFCTHVSNKSEFRKPNIGMANMALRDFPNIDFQKSIMVGDSDSDIVFGQKLGMMCVKISNEKNLLNQGFVVHESLFDFSISVKNKTFINF